MGVRVFNEINASLAGITGVSMNDPGVKSTYLLVEQQLPSIPTVESFVAANQVGVAQMAIQYCDSLVESAAASSFFPGLNFAAAPATAFANTNALINPLITAGIGTGLATQPDDVDVRAEINSLVDEALELRRQLCEFGAHQDDCQGGLRRRARQRHAPDQVTATPRPTRPTMKIRRKQALGPKEPLRHPDHPRPVTRREFLGQGFITGSVALAGVSAFSLFADPRKAYATLSPDIAQLKLPVSQGGLCDIKLGAGMIPFICFDLAGGANIAGSNVLVGQKGGQLDFLSTAGYSKLGLPGNMTPNSSIGVGSFVDRQLGLAFHSDSAFLRGILERTAVATRANVNGTVIPALSQNDTANNPHNPMYGIYSTGARGDLLTLIGTDNSDSGGNSMAPSYMMVDTARPTKVDQASDVTGLVDTGKLVGLLSQSDATLVLESMERISKKKLDKSTMLSVPTADEVVKDLVQCGYVRAADLADRYGNSKQALDPDIDPMIVGPTGIFTQAEYDATTTYARRPP